MKRLRFNKYIIDLLIVLLFMAHDFLIYSLKEGFTKVDSRNLTSDDVFMVTDCFNNRNYISTR